MYVQSLYLCIRFYVSYSIIDDRKGFDVEFSDKSLHPEKQYVTTLDERCLKIVRFSRLYEFSIIMSHCRKGVVNVFSDQQTF